LFYFKFGRWSNWVDHLFDALNGVIISHGVSRFFLEVETNDVIINFGKVDLELHCVVIFVNFCADEFVWFVIEFDFFGEFVFVVQEILQEILVINWSEEIHCWSKIFVIILQISLFVQIVDFIETFEFVLDFLLGSKPLNSYIKIIVLVLLLVFFFFLLLLL